MPDPLDLARCRALCGEAEARAELRLTTASQVREVTTALPAACDEVERLREAHGARHAELPPVDWETNGGIEP